MSPAPAWEQFTPSPDGAPLLYAEHDTATAGSDEWHKVTVIAYVRGTEEEASKRAVQFAEVPRGGVPLGPLGVWVEPAT